VKIIKPSFEILSKIDGEEILKNLELVGRVCYKSEEKITEDSARKFVKGIIKSGHETILEHEKVTVRIICDRGVSHELVRHRIISPSQESTRFVKYNDVTFIEPCFWNEDPEMFTAWKTACESAEKVYSFMLDSGAKPQEARSVLPNSLKTELVITANMREWRHIFKLRAIGTTGKPHPQMLEIMVPMLQEFKTRIPVIFDDLTFNN